MDPFELNSIKAMVLFNPDTPSLQETLKIETLQEKVQTSLDEYCRSQKPHQLGRFGRILLRLPSLRTVNASTIETSLSKVYHINDSLSIPMAGSSNSDIFICKYSDHQMTLCLPGQGFERIQKSCSVALFENTKTDKLY
ncbi:hypothetical protein DICVIV_09989 [Dictyocaulus viviparus]|uniref:NR LBD domain-containing protein n=1 Tax=Dictyocaulus viviparus TaxID=29172 RepID=A0A0D8XJS4_DICVI|nr:hypothetical protein DICVIV_09989 [Dictyocaulus viviparus]